MKVRLLKNNLCADIAVDTVLDVIPGMEVDAEGVFNIPAGMCYLCKTPSGKLRYVLATNVEIVDASTIDWEQVRIQAAIAAMQGVFASKDIDLYRDDVVKIAVIYADSLIEELKIERNENNKV